MISYDLVGVEFANRQLASLDQKIRRSVVRKATRAGGNVILKVVRDETPKRTGALRAASRLKVDRNIKTGIETAEVKINPKTRRRRRGREIRPSKYFHLVTRGTKAHDIRPRRRRALAFGESEAYSRVRHRGARANDYYDRAFNRSNRAALATFTTSYRTLVNQEANQAAARNRARAA